MMTKKHNQKPCECEKPRQAHCPQCGDYCEVCGGLIVGERRREPTTITSYGAASEVQLEKV